MPRGVEFDNTDRYGIVVYMSNETFTATWTRTASHSEDFRTYRNGRYSITFSATARDWAVTRRDYNPTTGGSTACIGAHATLKAAKAAAATDARRNA